jgi:uncharacterized protein (DUF924 family)
MHTDVLAFWFEEIDPRRRFAADSEFDDLIRARFLGLIEQAAAGELFPWRVTAPGRLAEIIVLDQFPRNVYRNTARAFAYDPIALVLAQEALAAGALGLLEPTQRSFLLLPYMHSESQRIHAIAETLFKDHAPEVNYGFELQHKAIIDRFGRYPHRNAVLGRASTANELEFLAQPGSRF